MHHGKPNKISSLLIGFIPLTYMTLVLPPEDETDRQTDRTNGFISKTGVNIGIHMGGTGSDPLKSYNQINLLLVFI